MKMSDIFKLPLTWKRYKEKDELRIKIEIYDKSEELLRGFFYNMNDDEVSAIITAVNSHDTQLADIDRLLAALKPFAEWGKSLNVEKYLIGDILKRVKVAAQAYDKHKGE